MNQAPGTRRCECCRRYLPGADCPGSACYSCQARCSWGQPCGVRVALGLGTTRWVPKPKRRKTDKEQNDVARKVAERMEGKCERPKDLGDPSGWCSWHDSRWFAGRAVCERMADYIRLAEQAIKGV